MTDSDSSERKRSGSDSVDNHPYEFDPADPRAAAGDALTMLRYNDPAMWWDAKTVARNLGNYDLEAIRTGLAVLADAGLLDRTDEDGVTFYRIAPAAAEQPKCPACGRHVLGVVVHGPDRDDRRGWPCNHAAATRVVNEGFLGRIDEAFAAVDAELDD